MAGLGVFDLVEVGSTFNHLDAFVRYNPELRMVSTGQ
jgi:hypothetical protein